MPKSKPGVLRWSLWSKTYQLPAPLYNLGYNCYRSSASVVLHSSYPIYVHVASRALSHVYTIGQILRRWVERRMWPEYKPRPRLLLEQHAPSFQSWQRPAKDIVKKNIARNRALMALCCHANVLYLTISRAQEKYVFCLATLITTKITWSTGMQHEAFTSSLMLPCY